MRHELFWHLNADSLKQAFAHAGNLTNFLQRLGSASKCADAARCRWLGLICACQACLGSLSRTTLAKAVFLPCLAIDNFGKMFYYCARTLCRR